jgi:hypothetical protein
MEKDQRPPGATDHAPPRDARPGEGKHVTQFSVATTECAGNGKERPGYQFSVATNEYIGQGKEKAEYQFSVATNEYIGQGKEKAEYQSIVKAYRHHALGNPHNTPVVHPRSL